MYGWEESYKAAALETEQSKLRQRITTALTAINRRIRELNEGHDGSAHERAAIRDALDVLSVLSVASDDAEHMTPRT